MNKSYLRKITGNGILIIPVDTVRKFKWEDKLLKLNWFDNSIIVEEINKNDINCPFIKKLSCHVTGYRLLIPLRFSNALNSKVVRLTVFEDSKKIIIRKGRNRKGGKHHG